MMDEQTKAKLKYHIEAINNLKELIEARIEEVKKLVPEDLHYDLDGALAYLGHVNVEGVVAEYLYDLDLEEKWEAEHE